MWVGTPPLTSSIFGVRRWDLARIEPTRRPLDFDQNFLRAAPQCCARIHFPFLLFQKVRFFQKWVKLKSVYGAHMCARTQNILQACTLDDFVCAGKILVRAHPYVHFYLKIWSATPPREKMRFFEILNCDILGARAPKFSKIKIWNILCIICPFLKNFGVRARGTPKILCPNWLIFEKMTFKKESGAQPIWRARTKIFKICKL